MGMRREDFERALLDAHDRLDRSRRRMSPGSLGGRSEQAQPLPSRPAISSYPYVAEEQRYDWPGPLSGLIGAMSTPYTVRRSCRLTLVILELATAGTGSPVGVGVFKNNVQVGGAFIAAGQRRQKTMIDVPYVGGVDAFRLQIANAGTGAESLTATVTLA